MGNLPPLVPVLNVPLQVSMALQYQRVSSTENERLALRSIDIFADGRTRNIPDLYDGVIEITPIPTVEELNAHVWGEEFHACIIEQAEFEAIWETHAYDGALKESGGI